MFTQLQRQRGAAMAQTVSIRHQRLVTAAPIADGGADEGPCPPALLGAA